MNNKTLLNIGIIGSVVTALCCFSPILIVLFGALGLSAVIGLLDYVLIPALIGFLLLTIYALFKRKRKKQN